MNLGELQTRLGTLLKVKTKRYPLDIRTDHINQAIRDLEDEFEGRYKEAKASFYTEENTGEYVIDSSISDGLQFVNPIAIFYYEEYPGEEIPLEQKTLEELFIEYPADYTGPVDSEADDPETGAPLVYAIWEGQFFIRPIPDGAYLIQVRYIGQQRELSSPGESNDWTNNEPYAVLYTAAVYGCIEVLEESRAKTFVSMADKKISNISIRESAGMSGRRPVSQEPGATQGV